MKFLNYSLSLSLSARDDNLNFVINKTNFQLKEYKRENGNVKRWSARPQALTCQGRRRSAAAAHAKGPARPMSHPLFVRRGFGEKTRKFLFFLRFIPQLFSNLCCVARCIF